MTVIVVRGIGPRVSFKHMVNVITKILRMRFEALSAELSPSKKSKTFYFRLPDNADVSKCLKLINGFKMNHRILNAFAAKNDSKIRVRNKSTPMLIPERLCKKLNMAFNHTKEQMLTITSKALLCELYSKYPGILNLSERTKTSVVGKLYKAIKARVKDIQDQHENVEYKTMVSEEYRSKYPHKSDFGLVKGCYNAAGGQQPLEKEELLRKDTEATVLARMESVPMKTIMESSATYARNISAKIRQYIDSLNTEEESTLDEPRLRVRQELKKMTPYVQSITQQTMYAIFEQDKELKIRIYGVPTLPPRNVMRRFLKDFDAEKPAPFPDLHNCMDVTVPRPQRDNILAYDGSTIEGCRLMIVLLERIPFKRLMAEANALKRVQQVNDLTIDADKIDLSKE